MLQADHSQFQFAAERYVLDELPEPERLSFEEHFFQCESCAQDVEHLTNLRIAAPAVWPLLTKAGKEEKKTGHWWRVPWLSTQLGLGTAAALGLICMYQNTVQIPKLKLDSGQTLQVMAAPRVLTARRGAGPLVFSAHDRAVPLVISNEWPQPYARYRANVSRLGAKEPLYTAEAAPGGGSLLISIPASKLGAGEFELTLSGSREGSPSDPLARYPFRIEESDTR